MRVPSGVLTRAGLRPGRDRVPATVNSDTAVGGFEAVGQWCYQRESHSAAAGVMSGSGLTAEVFAG